MKILIEYKNGTQIVGDTKALIMSYPPSEIRDSMELDEQEYEELVLTVPEE